MKISYKFMNSSIKKQIWLSILIVTTFTSLLFISFTYYMYEKLYIEKQVEALQLQGVQLKDMYYETSLETFSQQLKVLDESLESSIIYTDDPMLLGSGSPVHMFEGQNLISFQERQQLLEGETVQIVRLHERLNQEILAVVVPLLSQDQLVGAIFLYLPLEAISNVFQPIRLVLYVGIPIAIIIVLLAGFTISNYVTKPILDIKNVTEKMAKGDYSSRIKVKRENELSHLALSINKLSYTLEKVEEERRGFLANVSHELRTPLSYMKGYTEGFEEGLVDREKYILTVQKEVDRMERLVHNLLDLAQLEGDSYPIEFHPLVLSELIVDVVSRLEWVANEKNVSFEHTLNEEIIVFADRDRLDQVLTNIVQNAITYSKQFSSIFIELTTNNGKANIIIRDEGIGIPEKDLPHIMERFYRVNKARTRADGGTGLGLAIAEQIIKKHQGSINIHSKINEGTTVTISLPIFELE
ncbi:MULTISPECIES: sensor histidine kinase [Sutcliffiella]|nr:MULTISPECIES: ATP-binding protein [Sutcliffiella]MED4014867.1 ATP-binding protein [Sutcliffiella cohnii]WBL17391.1 ATP-binding protein [Sutcliffiella sp. NC1]